jgi:hypothetical protein
VISATKNKQSTAVAGLNMIYFKLCRLQHKIIEDHCARAAGLSKWCSNPVIANVGMPTIQSVSRIATRHHFVGKQRILVFAQSLPVVLTYYCLPNLPQLDFTCKIKRNAKPWRNERTNERRTNEPGGIFYLLSGRHLYIVHTSSQAQWIWYKYQPRQYKHRPNNTS